LKIRYTERSAIDLETAFDWYQRQLNGLGHDFLDEVDNSLQLIINYPENFPTAYKEFRRNVMKRFPFSIYYTIEGEIIVIHSIFDSRQDPTRLP
jgi:plasmid stabilization system protein ParE